MEITTVIPFNSDPIYLPRIRDILSVYLFFDYPVRTFMSDFSHALYTEAHFNKPLPYLFSKLREYLY